MTCQFPSCHFISRTVAVIALAGAALGAHAANLSTNGHLVFNTDTVKIAFTVDAASPITLWTDSWQAGLNFDPELAVFDATSQLVTIGDDTPDVSALLPGQGGYDSQIRIGAGGLALASGNYWLVLSASGNDPVGPTLADGYSLFGTAPVAIADWNQPSYDINTNNQKGSYWQVHLDGVGAAVPAVPEPSEWALMLSGFGAIALARWRFAAAAEPRAVKRPRRQRLVSVALQFRRILKPPLASENTTSTRRFNCRPADVSLLATA